MLIAGDDEVDARNFQLKVLATGEQTAVACDEILTAVREVLGQ